MILRPARPRDAAAIGHVHVASWRETYPGIVPAGQIAALDPAERAGVWARAIAAGQHVTVAEDETGLAGFAMAAVQREPEVLPCDGEVWSLYLLRRAQRQGLGRALMADAARALAGRGFGSASVWVMTANAPAMGFYTALGGRVALRRTVDHRGWQMDETAFLWDRLSDLAP